MRPVRSTGCHACRKMKKKCDEGKPGCARCEKAERKCPGYRSDSPDFVFKSMNDSAMIRINKPTMLSTASSSSQPFFIQPSTDWSQYAISRFIYHFVEKPSDYGLPGYLEFLPTMLNSADQSFQTCLLAASLANLANVSGMQQLLTESKVQYGRALRSLATSIYDKSRAASDHTLLALLLIQKYEVIAGDIDIRKDPHDKATTEILRLRRQDREMLSSKSSSLSRIVLVRKELQAIDNRVESSMDFGPRRVDAVDSFGSNLRLLFRDIFVTSQKLRAFVNIEGEATDLQLEAFTEAWNFSSEVYTRFLLWPSLVPPAWKMEAFVLPTTPSHIEGLQNRQGHVYLFTSLKYGTAWVGYLCSRIHLCQNLLMGCHFVRGQQCYAPSFGASFQPPQEEVLETLYSTVDDIIGCSPFLLGDVNTEGQINETIEKKALGAFFLLRGADVALSVERLSRKQQHKLLQLLWRIGTEFGLKIALKRRERWLADHQGQA